MKSVYLSASLPDLAEHRQAALQAAKSLGWQVQLNDHPDLDHNLAALGQAQLFIGIYAVYYGDLLPQDDISFLERLYQESQMLPRLIYVLAPKESWAIDLLHTDERGAWMRMFWERLHQENPHLRYFTTPSDLETKIRFDLARLAPKPSNRVQSQLLWGILGLALVLALLGLVVLRIAP